MSLACRSIASMSSGASTGKLPRQYHHRPRLRRCQPVLDAVSRVRASPTPPAISSPVLDAVSRMRASPMPAPLPTVSSPVLDAVSRVRGSPTPPALPTVSSLELDAAPLPPVAHLADPTPKASLYDQLMTRIRQQPTQPTRPSKDATSNSHITAVDAGLLADARKVREPLVGLRASIPVGRPATTPFRNWIRKKLFPRLKNIGGIISPNIIYSIPTCA